MNIAIVYDHVNKIGGAERILVALHELFPHAPLYTPFYNSQKAPWAKNIKVISSFLEVLPFANQKHELYPGLPILAIETFDFKKFDIVISVTSAEAKGVITSPETLHICYCLTPTRYLWSHYFDYFPISFIRKISLPIISLLRIWDYVASHRPDVYVAISDHVAKRISKYYRQKSSVIYPPVDIDKFSPSTKKTADDYYLVVSRFVRYKHIEIAIEACAQLGVPLKIIGSGTDENRLKRIAGRNVEFLGNLTEDDLVHYYQNCKALLFVQEEDFGITALEAQACGKPVIAYQVGGSKEMIIEGETGEFFEAQNADSLAKTMRIFAQNRYNKTSCRKQAERFATERFKDEFKHLIDKEWREFNTKL